MVETERLARGRAQARWQGWRVEGGPALHCLRLCTQTRGMRPWGVAAHEGSLRGPAAGAGGLSEALCVHPVGVSPLTLPPKESDGGESWGQSGQGVRRVLLSMGRVPAQPARPLGAWVSGAPKPGWKPHLCQLSKRVCLWGSDGQEGLMARLGEEGCSPQAAVDSERERVGSGKCQPVPLGRPWVRAPSTPAPGVFQGLWLPPRGEHFLSGNLERSASALCSPHLHGLGPGPEAMAIRRRSCGLGTSHQQGQHLGQPGN